MPIVIHPNVPLAATQGAAPTPVVLQPGTVISARVLQVLGSDTAQIAIGGQSISVLSQVPLQPGQTLQLAVSQATDGSVRLAVVNTPAGAPASAAGLAAATDTVTLAPGAVASIAPQTAPVVVANNQLTPLEALAVSVAAESAATHQASLAPLFANLGVAVGLNGLPPPVLAAVAQVLAQQIPLDQNLTGADIKQAFQNSGLFLEASLAAGSLLSQASGATPDLKAALIVLRQVLATALDAAPATPGLPPAAATVPQAATTSAAVTAQGAPVATATPPGATPAAVPQAAAPVAVVVGQGAQAAIEILSQPITITAGPETAITASPAPPLVGEIAAPAVLSPGATATAVQELLNLGAASQVILAASTPADAAARTAASSAALNLLQEALQAGPLAATPLGFALENNQMLSLVPAVTGSRIPAIDDAEFARTNLPPPPISGALPTAQPVMPATLVSNSPFETAMHHLLADTDGAIARQTLLQVASLPGHADTTAPRLDPAAPRWNFEIPFATPQGTAVAQFEISRDGGGSEVEAAKRVWRARFSLDVEPAGPVHALISLNGDRTSVRMWAERPATAAQLRAGAGELSQALSRAELSPGDIVIREGAPVQTASAPAGHFLDRAL